VIYVDDSNPVMAEVYSASSEYGDLDFGEFFRAYCTCEAKAVAADVH